MDEVKQERDVHVVDMLPIWLCSYSLRLGKHLLIVKEFFGSRQLRIVLFSANFGLLNELVDVCRMTALFLA
jgi:hypothetical protein